MTNPTSMDSDALLVRRAVSGDERAMRLLWARHAAHVDAVVRRLAPDPDVAADIAQDVWIQIFRALPTWRGDSQFGTWAHRVAVNRTLNALRSVKRLGRHETSLEALVEEQPGGAGGYGRGARGAGFAAVEPEGERALLAASIEEAARQLAPGARQVFLLHDVEGYTHEEIAETLGITAGGSKSQLFKARVKLRKLLAHLVDGGTAAERSAPAQPSGTMARSVSPPPTVVPISSTGSHAAPRV